MAWDLSIQNVLGVSTAVAIILVGTFVLVARPRAATHRAFFLFALMDGMSSGLFALRDMTDEAGLRAYFMGTYYYFYLAFIVGLVGIGLLYPLPLGGERARKPLLYGVVGAGVVTLALYTIDHGWFWYAREGGFGRATAGILVETVFPLGVLAVIAKLTNDSLSAATPVAREQSAVMLAGMLVGYGTVIAAQAADAVSNPQRTFGSVVMLWRGWAWIVFLSALAYIAIAAILIRRRAQLAPFARRVVAAALVTAGVFVAAAFFGSGQAAAGGATLGYVLSKWLGLLAFPVLLAIAIFRAEAFEINPQLRRATVLTLVGATIATTFVLLENFLQGFLEASLLAGLGSDLVVGILSALVAAAIIIPLLGVARRIATRFLPVDAEHVHNLATYRLVLEGALQDGLLDARESRTLDALREALRISEREHEVIIRGVREARARATAAPPGAVEHGDGVEAGPSF